MPFRIRYNEIVRCQQRNRSAMSSHGNLMEITHQEIQQAQRELNTHPDASPFWDTPMGQAVLEIRKLKGLAAQNTNRDRCAIYAMPDARAGTAGPTFDIFREIASANEAWLSAPPGVCKECWLNEWAAGRPMPCQPCTDGDGAEGGTQ